MRHKMGCLAKACGPWASVCVVLAVTSAFLFFFFFEGRASAYNGTEHTRFPDQAYQIMNIMRRGGFYADQANRISSLASFQPLTVRPSSIPVSSEADWEAFVSQAIAAPALLDQVRVGLVKPSRASTDCGGVFAALPEGSQFARCRAGELAFAPQRNWAQNINECYIRANYQFGGAGNGLAVPGGAGNDKTKVIPFFEGLPTNYTGSLLGMWATKPDDETSDTEIFVRPSNVLFLGAIKNAVETVVEDGVLLFFAPVACLAAFIDGDASGCLEQAEQASHSVDLVARVDDSVVLPIEEGIGSQVGLGPLANLALFNQSNPASMWHFIVPGVGGEFNSTPGILMAGARFQGQSDAVDAGLSAYFDLLGITVDPYKSTGIGRYGVFADGPIGRMDGDWAGSSVAHVEFDPVKNLARYGWKQFLQTGTARGLGWVLHAIGDAACPQHAIGTLGWGHQPWERYADVRWADDRGFREDRVEVQLPNMVTELAYAFQYWTFANQQPQADWVGPLVQRVAQDIVQLPFASIGHAFKGSISVDWFTGSNKDSDATNAYDSDSVAYRDIMMRAVGVSIAFLAKASVSVPPGPTSPCACTTPGTARSGEDRTGKLITPSDGSCVACGSGVFQQEPNFLDGRCVAFCPPDRPTSQGGTCTAQGACPATMPFVKAGACVAACCTFDSTCPTASPFRENGVCVPLSGCSTPFVVDERTCATSCPVGQVPDPANYCGTSTSSSAAQCSPSASDTAGACCAPRAAVCQVDMDCCSGGCRQADGICEGATAEPCVVNADCVAGSCKNGKCAGVDGDRCVSGADCTIECVLGRCCGAVAEACAIDNDCCLGELCGDNGFCFPTEQ